MRPLSRWDIAASGNFPDEVASACLSVLARDPLIWDYLAQNRALPADVWLHVWGARRQPAARAEALCARNLPRALRDAVLVRESRVGVLSALIRANVLDTDEQERLVASAPPAVLDVLAQQPWLSVKLRRAAVESASPITLLRELAYDRFGLFSDEDAAAALSEPALRGAEPARLRSVYLRALLFHRPGVLSSVLSDGGCDSIATAAAGSVTLSAADAARLAVAPSVDPVGELKSRRFTLMALVANPVVPLDVVEQVQEVVKAAGATHDFELSNLLQAVERRLRFGSVVSVSSGQELSREASAALLRRGMPSEWSPGREIELLMVVTGVGPTEEERAQAWSALQNVATVDLLERHAEALDASGWGAPKPLGGPVLPAQDPRQHVWDMLADKLGASATRWENMLGLLEGFEGSLEDLLDVSVAL